MGSSVVQSSRVIPMILAGGKGERFWPLSRREYPKQFLSLDGSGKTLLQATADRLKAMTGSWDDVWVVTAAHLADGVREQLPEMPERNLLVEPQAQDTAPAVAWATLEAAKHYGDEAILGFFPADHWIEDEQAFFQTVNAAAELSAKQGAIATLGIKPTFASTGYGYIEQGDALGEFGGLPAHKVSRFTEKPDATKAQEFIDSGRFSWNGGMFIFQIATALAELRTHAPGIMGPLEEKGIDAYPSLTKLSIDYALMEKTDRACVVPITFGWDDLGDWNAIERLLKQEADNNVELCQHVSTDSEGCILYTQDDGELVATIGLKDVVVVRAGKATLIVDKSRTQEIKPLLKQIRENPKYQDLL